MIKTGDLVMVVKPESCGCTRHIGMVFKAGEVIRSLEDEFECIYCGRDTGSETLVFADEELGYFDIEALKKIDPPALPETIEQQDELTV